MALVVGYFLAAGSVALLAAGFHALGMARSEAVVLSAMLGFLIYLALLIWAFAEPRLWRIALLLIGGALATQLAALFMAGS